jgi:hypothetical protein
MHFKLDWTFVKDYVIRNSGKFEKFDFYEFEDRIDLHKLPTIPFTKGYLEKRPEHYRIIPRKLFFDFFPEFDDKRDILPSRPIDSLID